MRLDFISYEYDTSIYPDHNVVKTRCLDCHYVPVQEVERSYLSFYDYAYIRNPISVFL